MNFDSWKIFYKIGPNSAASTVKRRCRGHTALECSGLSLLYPLLKIPRTSSKWYRNHYSQKIYLSTIYTIIGWMRKSLDPFSRTSWFRWKKTFKKTNITKNWRKNEMPSETNFLKIKGLINLMFNAVAK